MAALLKYTGALFCLHAAGALVQVGHERAPTLFDDEEGRRRLLGPVNRLAKFLKGRRGEPEYEEAWEEIHEFAFSVVYSLRCVYRCVNWG